MRREPKFSASVYCGQTVAHLSYCWSLVLRRSTHIVTLLITHHAHIRFRAGVRVRARVRVDVTWPRVRVTVKVRLSVRVSCHVASKPRPVRATPTAHACCWLVVTWAVIGAWPRSHVTTNRNPIPNPNRKAYARQCGRVLEICWLSKICWLSIFCRVIRHFAES